MRLVILEGENQLLYIPQSEYLLASFPVRIPESAVTVHKYFIQPNSKKKNKDK